MKLFKYAISGLFLLFFLFSCIKPGTGAVSFGANYDIINCITTVTIYVDGENMGQLKNPSMGVSSCNQPENLNLKLPAGDHHYRIEIRPLEGTGYSKDIVGNFKLNENDCIKIFIDYAKIEWRN